MKYRHFDKFSDMMQKSYDTQMKKIVPYYQNVSDTEEVTLYIPARYVHKGCVQDFLDIIITYIK
jgi:hypothetical protein